MRSGGPAQGSSPARPRYWERLEDASGRSFVGRFLDFAEANPPYGLGITKSQLRKVPTLDHPRQAVPDVAARMDRMRAEVHRLLAEAVAPTTENRGHLFSERHISSRDTRANVTEGDTPLAVLARLKRDAEKEPEAAELAARVTSGEMTANAAARAKGWRKPRILLTSPESIARALRQHLDSDTIAELVRLLLEPTDG